MVMIQKTKDRICIPSLMGSDKSRKRASSVESNPRIFAAIPRHDYRTK